jgi:hypothetical protein
MLDETDRAVLGWAAEVSGVTNPALSLPVTAPEQTSVYLYLYAVADHPPMRGNGRTPLQFTARYLVTVTGPDTLELHRILGELIFAAMEHTTFDVTLEPANPGLWQALGLPPLPAFTLNVPVRRERPERQVSMVRQALSIDAAPLRVIEGVVTAPGGIPLPDVKVQLDAAGASGASERSASTDRSGRFQLTVGPLADEERIRLSAKNHVMTATLADSTGSDGIVRVQFDPFDR